MRVHECECDEWNINKNDLECKNGQQNRDLNPDPIQRGEKAVSQGLVVMLIIMESNIC